MINLWLAMGPIVFIPVQFFIWWLLTKPRGLRRTILFSAWCVIIAAALRLPLAWWPHLRKDGVTAMVLITIAAGINAAAGPSVMSPVSQLSTLWFPENFRTQSTAIAAEANVAGVVGGFIVLPYVSKCCGLDTLNYILFGMAAVLWICAHAYLPARPKTAPSAAALESVEFTEGKISATYIVRELFRISKIPSVSGLALMYGIVCGAALGAWTGLFDPMIQQIFNDPNDVFAGWVGFVVNLSVVIGALAVAVVADRWFPQRLKLLLIIGVAASAAMLWLFTLQMPSIISEQPLLPHSKVMVIIAVSITGICIGTTVPIFYELVAEITFPTNEGTSAGLLTLSLNVFAALLLLVQSKLPITWINFIMAGSFTVIAAGLLYVTEVYKRKEFEAVCPPGVANLPINQQPLNPPPKTNYHSTTSFGTTLPARTDSNATSHWSEGTVQPWEDAMIGLIGNESASPLVQPPPTLTSITPRERVRGPSVLSSVASSKSRPSTASLDSMQWPQAL
eukprot:TRINITY_DN27767_c0_g1_i1.p1 TRINITY_DN27767_c0_g1~~TRINITY_DN27767_c0_g1_i1.p1  ORF type:complete len:507 (+),score=18.43 TRINITY_DN27767_c0_g1_i1:265-1785(+)